jgi:hypothetical protein
VAGSLAYLAPEQAMPLLRSDQEMHLAALSIKQDSYLVGRLGMDVMLPLRPQLDWVQCNEQDYDSVAAYLHEVQAADWEQELGMLRAAGLAATADLQAALLAASPEQRPTAAEALQHPCLAVAVAGMEAVVARRTLALLASKQSVLQLLPGQSPELQPTDTTPCPEQQHTASPAEAANMSSSHSSSSNAGGVSVEVGSVDEPSTPRPLSRMHSCSSGGSLDEQDSNTMQQQQQQQQMPQVQLSLGNFENSSGSVDNNPSLLQRAVTLLKCFSFGSSNNSSRRSSSTTARCASGWKCGACMPGLCELPYFEQASPVVGGNQRWAWAAFV